MFRDRTLDQLSVDLSKSTDRRSIIGAAFGLAALALQDASTLAAKKRQKRRRNNSHRPNAEVVGGHDVPPGTDLGVVALLNSKGGTRFKRKLCGGSLLDSRHVLTAAHCVVTFRGKVKTGLSVGIGILNLDDESQGEERDVEIFVHPQYNDITNEYDLAILKFDAPVDIGRYKTVLLPGPSDIAADIPGSTLTLAGWGSILPDIVGKKDRMKFVPRLQIVDLGVRDINSCAKEYKKIRTIFPSLMFCADTDGRAACWGDSGGPLFKILPNGDIVQYGIVSFGEGCADPRFGTVYTRLADAGIQDFIVDTTENPTLRAA
jgi:secreted trypsin-like serine protease